MLGSYLGIYNVSFYSAVSEKTGPAECAGKNDETSRWSSGKDSRCISIGGNNTCDRFRENVVWADKMHTSNALLRHFGYKCAVECVFKPWHLFSLWNGLTSLPTYSPQQVKVTLNDEDMDTFVFAVGSRKAMARMQKEMQDLVSHSILLCHRCVCEYLCTDLLSFSVFLQSEFCGDKPKSGSKYGLSDSLSILSEMGEVTDGVMDSKVSAEHQYWGIEQTGAASEFIQSFTNLYIANAKYSTKWGNSGWKWVNYFGHWSI